MAGDFLVPLLRTEGGAPDPAAIETWHIALSATVAIEIPHDLFALWLYPPRGGSVLLGPPALAEDHIDVPVPAPLLQQNDLYGLEETLRRAHYASAMAAPVRPADGSRDLGVVLLGGFEKSRFGPGEALTLRRLAVQLAPVLADLGGRVVSAPAALLEHGLTRETLPEHLARAVCEATDGLDLVRRASGTLHQLIPHDRLEILTVGAVSGTLMPLSGAGRRRWTGPGGSEARDPLGPLAQRFGESSTLLIPDLAEIEGLRWQLESPAVAIHALLAARLTVGGDTAGYVLLGSVTPDAFREEDEELLGFAALLLAPRVHALRGAGTAVLSLPAPGPAAEPAEDPPLPRAAAALAGTAELAEGLRRFGEELARVLPHDGISIQLRRGEFEILPLDPEMLRPLSDVPGRPLEDFPGRSIFQGKEWASRMDGPREEIFVPLAVAGRMIGALGVRTRGVVSGRAAAAIARQFADVLAAHVELVRRASLREPRPLTPSFRSR